MTISSMFSSFALGAFILKRWLFHKGVYYACPRCNFPFDEKENQCGRCGQPIKW